MKIHYKYKTIMVGFAFMAIMSFWQMYDNIIPLILKNSFELNDVLIGAIMAIDNVLALFLLPFFGTWSDKINTRFGKRIPFIIVGTLLANLAMFFMPIADNTRNLPLFMVMTGLVLLFMSVFRSPAVALMPDITPKHLRSKGNAIINLMGTVGAIYALAMIGVMVSDGDTPDYTPLFISIIMFMLITIGILAFVVKENKWGIEARNVDEMIEKEENLSKFSSDNNVSEVSDDMDTSKPVISEVSDDVESVQTVSLDISNITGGATNKLPKDKFRSLVFILLSVALWYIAYNAVTTAFSRYATKVWGSANGSYANYLMVATVAAIISYIPIGLISSKYGRKKVIMLGVVGLIIGFGSCFFATHAGPIVIALFVLVGISWASINVNSFPMAVDIATEGDIGKYTGYYYTFSMAAQVITPILSGWFLQYVSYMTLFPYAVIFSVLALITMSQVKHGDSIGTEKKSLLEHLDIDD